MICPPDYAYGEDGNGGIFKPDDILTYDLELMVVCVPINPIERVLEIWTDKVTLGLITPIISTSIYSFFNVFKATDDAELQATTIKSTLCFRKNSTIFLL